MKFSETPVSGAFIIDIEPREDSRGFFSRYFCRSEFERQGLDPLIEQINISLTHRKGTIRGLHFQAEPAADNKVVRCLAGAIFDVCVDLRPESPTRGRYVAAELSADNRRMLYLPPGCAHGFQTLSDNVEIMYSTNRAYAPAQAGGVRFDDPAFGIEWPLAVTEISDQDRAWPDFEN